MDSRRDLDDEASTKPPAPRYLDLSVLGSAHAGTRQSASDEGQRDAFGRPVAAWTTQQAPACLDLSQRVTTTDSKAIPAWFDARARSFSPASPTPPTTPYRGPSPPSATDLSVAAASAPPASSYPRGDAGAAPHSAPRFLDSQPARDGAGPQRLESAPAALPDPSRAQHAQRRRQLSSPRVRNRASTPCAECGLVKPWDTPRANARCVACCTRVLHAALARLARGGTEAAPDAAAAAGGRERWAHWSPRGVERGPSADGRAVGLGAAPPGGLGNELAVLQSWQREVDRAEAAARGRAMARATSAGGPLSTLGGGGAPEFAGADRAAQARDQGADSATRTWLDRELQQRVARDDRPGAGTPRSYMSWHERSHPNGPGGLALRADPRADRDTGYGRTGRDWQRTGASTPRDAAAADRDAIARLLHPGGDGGAAFGDLQPGRFAGTPYGAAGRSVGGGNARDREPPWSTGAIEGGVRGETFGGGRAAPAPRDSGDLSSGSNTVASGEQEDRTQGRHRRSV